MKEATSTKTPKLGQQTADGVFAGLTDDGTQQIYAMPTDLRVIMPFNDAAAAVKKLNADNALGHNDWKIGSLDAMRVLRKNQGEGSLKGTFNTTNKGSGLDFPDWYLSSSPYRDQPTGLSLVRFSDGAVDWGGEDHTRMSCRPVRLVAASAASGL
jgi:hypothetical protein